MNALLISSWLVVAAGIAPPVVIERFTSPPPQVLTGESLPPGEPPYSIRALQAGWEYTHLEPRARIAGSRPVPLRTRIHLWVGEDGSYRFYYSARWSLSGVANPMGDRDANAVDVEEAGKAVVSGDILLLEPHRTALTRRVKGTIVAQEITDNDRRAYLVRTEPMRLHIAGHCARFQVEPICAEGRDVWYQLTVTPVEPGIRRKSAPKPDPPTQR